MSFSSVESCSSASKTGPLLVCAAFGLSLVVPQAHAALMSSYNYGVRNTLRSVEGMAVPPPQPVFFETGSRSDDQGALVAFEGRPLGVVDLDAGVDGAGGAGPSPTISVRAEATGRALRTAAGVEYGGLSCQTPRCIISFGTAAYSLSWNAVARAESVDTINIDVSQYNGLAGQFVLPYEFTGTTSLDNDSRMSVSASTNFTITANDDEGRRLATGFAVANEGPVVDEPINRVDDFASAVTIPFVFGEPFQLISRLSSSARAFQGSNFVSDLRRVSALADYFNTARLNPFENFRVDSNGDGTFDTALDTGLLTISSLLNVDYLATLGDGGGDTGGGDNGGGGPDVPPVAVPEPGAFWLTALAGLGLWRQRLRLPSRRPRAIVPAWLKSLMHRQPGRSPSCCAAAPAVKRTPLVSR